MAGINELKKVAGVSSQTVTDVCNAILELTRKGEDVRIQGFGTFKKHHKEAYTGRNPATGEDVDVPAKDVLKFKPAKDVDMNLPKAAKRR